LAAEDNSFGILFYYTYGLPISGTYQLVGASSHSAPNTLSMFFSYKDALYVLPDSVHGAITAQAQNGKGKYVLDTTAFYDYNHPQDTVLIYGTFLAP
jgi:hypothetical protein